MSGAAPTTATYVGERQRTFGPRAVISRAQASRGLPTSRLDCAKEQGSAGPAAGTPMAASPRRPASWSTDRSPAASTVKTGRAVGGNDGVASTVIGDAPLTGGSWATVNCTRSPGARRAYGGRLGVKNVMLVRPISCHPPGEVVG